VDAADLWGTFAEHAPRVKPGGLAPARASGHGWFAVLTGEAHPDLNECVLTSRARAQDAAELVAFIAAAGVPALVSVASSAGPEVSAPLADAGFVPAPAREPLMWCATRPPRQTGGLRVEHVRSTAARAEAVAIVAGAHMMAPEVADRTLAPVADLGDRVMAWLAYAGDEAISVVWATPGPRIGIWSMMTPPAHRRRGGGRAVLTCALEELWVAGTEGAFLFSTPAGRPFYESAGFTPVDDATTWTSGASDEFLAAIGQPTAVADP
jgi:GNAT superfamily N-acetyltransferase